MLELWFSTVYIKSGARVGFVGHILDEKATYRQDGSFFSVNQKSKKIIREIKTVISYLGKGFKLVVKGSL